MKKNYFKVTTFIALLAFTLSVQAGDPVADMMKSGATDMTKLAGLELTPLGNSFAAGLGGGWYNTARPHKLLGFDLTVSLNLATIPDVDKTFNFSTQGFKALSLQNPSGPSTVPTFIASNDLNGPPMVLKTSQTTISVALPASITSNSLIFSAFKINASSSLPKGASFNGNNISFIAPATQIGDSIVLKGLVPKAIPFVAIPTPTAQLGIGLVFGTEVILRYMPSVGSGGFKIGLWGFGVKHDIKQWIPVVKDIPFFDLSALVGYTKLTTTYELSVTPSLFGETTGPNATIVDKSSPSSWTGQQMAIDASAFTGQILISKGLLLNIFTPYIGIGFTSTNFTIDIKGKYPLLKSALYVGGIDPVLVNVDNANPAKSTITANPAFSKFYTDDKVLATATTPGDYMELGKVVNSSVFMPNATVGLRLKLLLLTIHAQYTLQKYSMFSAGIGFAFR
jgi:hypothetical protein